MNVNQVVLVGNLTRDAELKHTTSGKAVAKFGIAVNRYTGKDKPTETTFVDVECWEKTAEIVGEYASKGRQVGVVGRLKLDQWESEGQKRSKLVVVADRVEFGPRTGEKSESPDEPSGEETPF